MSQNPEVGKIVRKVAKLDKAWKKDGKAEGRTENDLAMHLGRAYRAGVGSAARRAQSRNES